MRTQGKKNKLFWNTCYEISDHFRHSFCSTLLDLTRAIDPWDCGYDLESQQPSSCTRECLTVLRARTHDTTFRKDDSDLLKEFRCAERTAGTFILMHILFSPTMSRTISYYDAQLSRWSNFDLNSRRNFVPRWKINKTHRQHFSAAALFFRDCRKACKLRWGKEFRLPVEYCQYCYS